MLPTVGRRRLCLRTELGKEKFCTLVLHTQTTELPASNASGFQMSCALAAETPQPLP